MTESELRTILGQNLKRFRSLRGFSQAELAEMLDMSPNFISDMETGKRWLSSDTLVNLAESLNVDVWDFFMPQQTPTDDMSAFILRYTEKAATAASSAVIHSLENIRRQFIP